VSALSIEEMTEPYSGQLTVMQRPLGIKPVIEITQDMTAALAQAAIGSKLSPMLMLRMAEIGVSKEVIMSVLLNLSPSMRAVIDEWVPQLSAMYVRLLRNNEAINELKLVAMHSAEPELCIQEDEAHSVEAITQRLGHEKWYSIVYDPKSGLRSFIQVGRGLPEMLGYHMEEFLSRVAANDMPLPSPEIEFFCTCIHTIYNPGNSELKFFSRLNCKVPGISANEMWEFPAFDTHMGVYTVFKLHDSMGRLKQVRDVLLVCHQ
jgi:hypothetical protein